MDLHNKPVKDNNLKFWLYDIVSLRINRNVSLFAIEMYTFLLIIILKVKYQKSQQYI